MKATTVAVRRPAALFLLILILCAAGVWTATRLPSSIFPAVTFPRVKVIADAGEEPAALMIPAVTRPLEEAILRVPGIERVISTTARGSVEIGAEFSWGTDMQVALQRVQAQIERVRPDLLPGTRIQAEWMNTAVFPILGYALTSDTRSQSELRELAEFQNLGFEFGNWFFKIEIASHCRRRGYAKDRTRLGAAPNFRRGATRNGNSRTAINAKCLIGSWYFRSVETR